ncbi:MAG TPA: LysR substrate-binding domain-containing protein [Opitutaceae bacterium]|nr:LysR substrate-binding domain-containing protein [Opitutaceae bacterium]
MELRHLRYFIAVAHEENVTRAAAKLHVSQPPLTRQIRDLEDELGFMLFTRSGKSLRLTDAGRAFATEAKAVLARLHEGIALARKIALSHTGHLHVGYAPTPSATVLPQALQRFQRRHPAVKVSLHDKSTPQMLAGLRERKLDVALLMEPPKSFRGGIVFEPLQQFRLEIAVAPQHRLARRRRVPVLDLLAEPLVVLSRSEFPDYHELLARVLGRESKRLNIVEECDSGTSLIAAVEAGRGAAITISALAISAGRRLRLLPITPALPPAVMGIAHREGTTDKLTESFVREARDFARATQR